MTSTQIQKQLNSLNEAVALLGDQIQSLRSSVSQSQPDEDTQILRRALAEADVVSFGYQHGVSAEERRTVSITEIEIEDGQVVRFRGFDHLRDAYRRFRVDRITTTIALEPQIHYNAPPA